MKIIQDNISRTNPSLEHFCSNIRTAIYQEKIAYAHNVGMLQSNNKKNKSVAKAVENLFPLQKLKKKKKQDKTKHTLLKTGKRKIMKKWSWTKEL